MLAQLARHISSEGLTPRGARLAHTAGSRPARLVSIIICNYDYNRFIRTTIESALHKNLYGTSKIMHSDEWLHRLVHVIGGPTAKAPSRPIYSATHRLPRTTQASTPPTRRSSCSIIRIACIRIVEAVITTPVFAVWPGPSSASSSARREFRPRRPVPVVRRHSALVGEEEVCIRQRQIPEHLARGALLDLFHCPSPTSMARTAANGSTLRGSVVALEFPRASGLQRSRDEEKRALSSATRRTARSTNWAEGWRSTSTSRTTGPRSSNAV